MVDSSHRTASLLFVPFDRDAKALRDRTLTAIDELLDDPDLVLATEQTLGKRSPKSMITGRPAMAPDRALRACVLKHLNNWSFRQLEWELRNGIVYRHFTRFEDDPIPTYTVFCRTFAVFGDELTRRIHEKIVDSAREHGIAHGDSMRTDTTVVETNIHHPTDSTLLGDGIRVITRTLKRIAEQTGKGVVKVVDHARSVKNRLLEIYRAAKGTSETSRQKLVSSYDKLVGVARAVINQGKKVADELGQGLVRVDPVMGMVLEAQLKHYCPLVDQVIEQTKARVFDGNNHFPNKLLSIFEPESQVIRKGKVHKPTEFGRLVRVDEVENGIVSNYDVADGNPADVTQWESALNGHMKQFGHAPRRATGDRGFYSAENEHKALDLGVRRVALPARGRLSQSRAAFQKQPWFRKLMRWRAAGEGRIGTLKNRFRMARAMYKGGIGFKRWVGWCVIANNLTSIGRQLAGQKAKHDAEANNEKA